MRISFAAVLLSRIWWGKMPVYLCPPKAPRALGVDGSVAQLDRASHYGCEGLGFESLQSHERSPIAIAAGFFVPAKSEFFRAAKAPRDLFNTDADLCSVIEQEMQFVV